MHGCTAPRKVLDKPSQGINRCNSPVLVTALRAMRLVEELLGSAGDIVDFVVGNAGAGDDGVRRKTRRGEIGNGRPKRMARVH